MPSLSDHVKEWIEQAIDHHAPDEGMHYDLGLAQTAEGEPLFFGFLWMPAAILGMNFHRGFVLSNPPATTSASIDKMVGELVEEFRQARTAQLAEANQPPSPN